MKKTQIQWCHSTVNPVMGCDGCELWPNVGKVSAGIKKGLQSICAAPVSPMVLKQTLGKGSMSEIYRNRKDIARRLVERDKRKAGAVVDVIRGQAKCYAGLLGTFRGGHKGYAGQFERPDRFPRRMAKAARWRRPTEGEMATKPWLEGCPRMIFVSDMGDALSKNVSFDYLLQEIIVNVSSDIGSRHIWLWLTKRPAQMARFGIWLTKQGVAWPENLMAMTTVTAQSKSSRVDELRKVPSRLKGLSLEPLFEPVDLDLEGIDWVICGGGSDVLG
jgi:protein gp37